VPPGGGGGGASAGGGAGGTGGGGSAGGGDFFGGVGGGAGGRRFAARLGYSLAEAGEDYYEAYEFILSYALTRNYLLRLTVPYRSIDGHRLNEFGMMTRGYSQSGMGDISLFCWYNILRSGNASSTSNEKSESNTEEKNKETKTERENGKKKKKKEQPWRFMIGVGAKLPTGESDAKVMNEYVPAYYQVGSGTTDLLAGASCEKDWGWTDFYEQIIFHYIPGRNDIDYKRSNRIYIDVGQKFLLHEPTKTKFKIGLSDVYILNDNWDGLDNSGTLLGPRIGSVKGTKGHYLYASTGFSVSPTDNLGFDLGFRLPLNKKDEDSEQSLDYIVSMAVTFKF